jgi:hypothetical protein
MPTIPPHRFYVYILCRPPRRNAANGEPFYVGKGSGPRVFDHEGEARRGHICAKCAIIREIWKNGGEIQRYIVFTTDDEAEAYTYEIEIIALYGLHTLANYSPGGAGGERRITQSEETRAKRRAAAKAQWANPEVAARNRAAIKAAIRSPESRARRSAKMKAHWADPAYYERGSAINKARLSTPEARAQISAAKKPGLSTPKVRANLSAAARKRWQNPAFRERMSAMLAAQASEASKAAAKARTEKSREKKTD